MILIPDYVKKKMDLFHIFTVFDISIVLNGVLQVISCVQWEKWTCIIIDYHLNHHYDHHKSILQQHHSQ